MRDVWECIETHPFVGWALVILVMVLIGFVVAAEMVRRNPMLKDDPNDYGC